MGPVTYAWRILDILNAEFSTGLSQPTVDVIKKIQDGDPQINFNSKSTPSERLALLARAHFKAQNFDDCAEYGLRALAEKQLEADLRMNF